MNPTFPMSLDPGSFGPWPLFFAKEADQDLDFDDSLDDMDDQDPQPPSRRPLVLILLLLVVAGVGYFMMDPGALSSLTSMITAPASKTPATDEDKAEEPERWTETVLLPMRYTGLTGVDPTLWDEIIAENIEEVQQAAQEAGLKQVPQFDPVVNRADDAWEDVHGLLEREDTKIPMSRSEQIKLISLVVIAGSMIAITFFIVMATAG